MLVFKKLFFETETLNTEEKIGLILPLFIFLTLEAIFLTRLLNKSD